MHFRICLVVFAISSTVATLYATEPALLGSPDFQPTPEQPLGWRGDGTGHYPGAMPPTTWSRRAVSGATAAAVYQAKKPSGEPSKDAAKLELGIVKDWLVRGPFPSDHPP